MGVVSIALPEAKLLRQKSAANLLFQINKLYKIQLNGQPSNKAIEFMVIKESSTTKISTGDHRLMTSKVSVFSQSLF
jgi:hypothetical protein